MTAYLLDENVLRDLSPTGNINIRAWFASVAATARVKGFVLVTRNIADLRGCDVQVLDPFVKDPFVETV